MDVLPPAASELARGEEGGPQPTAPSCTPQPRRAADPTLTASAEVLLQQRTGGPGLTGTAGTAWPDGTSKGACRRRPRASRILGGRRRSLLGARPVQSLWPSGWRLREITEPWLMSTAERDSALKKDAALPPVTAWMALEGVVLSAISRTENTKTRDVTPMRNIESNEETKARGHSPSLGVTWGKGEGARGGTWFLPTAERPDATRGSLVRAGRPCSRPVASHVPHRFHSLSVIFPARRNRIFLPPAPRPGSVARCRLPLSEQLTCSAGKGPRKDNPPQCPSRRWHTFLERARWSVIAARPGLASASASLSHR